MLVAAIVGLDNRATMDLDTTLKNLPFTPDAIRHALETVCAISGDDEVVFKIGTILPIREDDIYGGCNLRFSKKIYGNECGFIWNVWKVRFQKSCCFAQNRHFVYGIAA